MYRLETKTAEFCSRAENLKETLEQIGHEVKNISEKLDSSKESSQRKERKTEDEGQFLVKTDSFCVVKYSLSSDRHI